MTTEKQTPHEQIVVPVYRMMRYHLRALVKTAAWLLALTLVFSVLWLRLMPFYEGLTTVTMLPTEQQLQYTEPRDDLEATSPAMILSQTHTEFLLSRTVAERVVRTIAAEQRKWMAEKALKLEGSAAAALYQNCFGPIKNKLSEVYHKLNYGYWVPPDPVEDLIIRLQQRTTVEQMPGSFVLQISVLWDNPRISARAANLLADIYVDLTRKANQEEMRVRASFISERIAETERDLRAIRKQLQAFKEKERVYAPDSDAKLMLDELSGYLRDYSSVRVELGALTGRMGMLKEHQTPEQLAMMKAEKAGIEAKLAGQANVIRDQIAKLDAFPAKEQAFVELQRREEETKNALATLQDRILETKITEAAQLSAIRVIDPAIPPVYPAYPMVLINCIVSVFAGLILAGGFVLFQDYQHKFLRSPADLAEYGMEPCGVVPYAGPLFRKRPEEGKSRLSRARLWALSYVEKMDFVKKRKSREQAVFNKHLDGLWLRLIGSDSCRIVQFTSVGKGAGRAFVLQELARTARRHSRRALLIDVDADSPKLADVLSCSSERGIFDVLTGNIPVQDVICKIDSHLDFVGTGVPAGDALPSDTGARLKNALNALKKDYSLILLRLPPLGIDPAVSLYWQAADEVFCLFDATASKPRDAELLRSRLQSCSANTTFLLNKVKYRGDYHFNA